MDPIAPAAAESPADEAFDAFFGGACDAFDDGKPSEQHMANSSFTGRSMSSGGIARGLSAPPAASWMSPRINGCSDWIC